MVGKVYSAAIFGVYAELVEIEADVSAGIPCYELTGNLGGTTKEAKERVRLALKNSNLRVNPSKITINLSPVNIRKEGPHFDLGIAIAVLKASGHISTDAGEGVFYAGELGLDGSVNPVKAVLPMVLCAKDNGFTACVVPKSNEQEAMIVSGIKIIGVNSLQQCLDYLNGEYEPVSAREELDIRNTEYGVDFSEIRGQYMAKRAALIAAASMHNLLMIGPPGAGKSMIAARIPTILPELSFDEAMEITRIYSVAGLVDEGRHGINERPFRSPEHTITASAMAGGGYNPIPGEMSLAHKGVLFLDELNMFHGNVIEAMRKPLETGHVVVNRLHGTYDYPADFMLVGAMNPCKCGYYPDRSRCTCTQNEVNAYFGKLSKPLLDRIDICVQVTKSSYEDINNEEATVITSAMMREKVEMAYNIQKERYHKCDFSLNSAIPSKYIKKYCEMTKDAALLLKSAYDRYDMSARSYFRTIKVARTIADIEASGLIEENHISEALGYKLV